MVHPDAAMGQETNERSGAAEPDATGALAPALLAIVTLAMVALVVALLPVSAGNAAPSMTQALWTLAACLTSQAAIRWIPFLHRRPTLSLGLLSFAVGMAFAAPCMTDPQARLAGLYLLPLLSVPAALSIRTRIRINLLSAAGIWLLVLQLGQSVQFFPLLAAVVCSFVWGQRRGYQDRSHSSPAPEELGELQKVAARLVRSREEERRRLARELHDGTGQLVHGLRLELDYAQLKAGESQEMKDVFSRMAGLLDQLNESVREILADLGPAILDDVGPAGAIAALARQHEQASDVAILTDLDTSLVVNDRVIGLTIYRIAQEALTNALRHSEAHTIRVIFRSAGTLRNGSPRSLVLIVADDGQGIKAARSGGYGLANMHERAALVGASLAIDSNTDGTTVRLRTPLVFHATAISSAMNVVHPKNLSAP